MMSAPCLSRRVLAPLGATVSCLLAVACSTPVVDPEPEIPFDSTGVVFTVVFKDQPADTMRVLFRDEQAIRWARDLAAFTTVHWEVIGDEIRKGPGMDPRYPFHWDPDEVGFRRFPGFIGDEECPTGPLPRGPQGLEYFIQDHGTRYCLVARPVAMDPPEPTVPFDSAGVVFTVVFRDYPADTMDVLLRLPAYIEAGKARVAQGDSARWAVLGGGRFDRGPGIDPRYAFHPNPEFVSFADGSVCQNHLWPPMKTDEEVDAFIVAHRGRLYCPTVRPISYRTTGG